MRSVTCPVGDGDSSFCDVAPANHAEEMVNVYCSRLRGEMELEVVEAWRCFAKHMQDSKCNHVVTCAGGDFAQVMKKAITTVLKDRYQIEFKDDFVAHCEKNDKKQAFIIEQHDVSFMINNQREMTEPSCVNLMTNEVELIPHMHSLTTGVVCISRTPMSKNRAVNKGCVKRGDEATGECFKQVEDIVHAHWPLQLKLECVKELAEKSEKMPGVEDGTCNVSDAEFMVQKLEEVNYWAVVVKMDALEFGSPVPRIRLWWAALLNISRDQRVSTFFNRVLNALKLHHADQGIEKTFVPITKCIIVDDGTRLRVGNDIGVESLHETGLRVPKAVKVDYKWKGQHSVIFPKYGLRWPQDHTSTGAVRIDGMLAREVELACFRHAVFEMPGEVEHEFLDINTDMERLLSACIDMHEDDVANVKKSPWRKQPPTLVGSSKVVVRYRSRCDVDSLPGDPCDVVVRALDGVEYMRLVGWCVKCWARPGRPANGASSSSSATQDLRKLEPHEIHDRVELVANLSGNSFSLYHFAPFELALMATYGRFLEFEGPPPAQADAKSVPGASTDDDASSVSS